MNLNHQSNQHLSTTIHDMRNELEGLDNEIKELKEKQRLLIIRLKKECYHPHDSLRECAYEKNFFVSTFPPMRVCMICGTWEEGWGCGYKALKSNSENSVPMIPRDELYRFRRGDQKGPDVD